MFLRPVMLQLLFFYLLSCTAYAHSPVSQSSSNPFSITPDAAGTIGSCAVSSSGNPFSNAAQGTASECGSSDPAVLRTGNEVNLGVGNPINVINGNKYQREVDMPALPGVLGLELVRHYNSKHAGTNKALGIFGRGWASSYETQLIANAQNLLIVQADGSTLAFACPLETPAVCTHKNSLYGTVTVTATKQGSTYQWRWPNGRVLHFDTHRNLEKIVAPTGEFVSLSHDAKGYLRSVRDPQGRTLQFHYPNREDPAFKERFRGVQKIDTPIGRFHYTYGSELPKNSQAAPTDANANLVKVEIPTHIDLNTPPYPGASRNVSSSSISRIYHYEDARFPTLLTGISILGAGSDRVLMHQRLVTWAYNADKQAILSVKGDAKSQLERVTLDFSTPGTTILTNSLGQKTTYHHTILANEYRLLDIQGAGCSTCGEVNRRYQYDVLGRLLEVTQLTEKGLPFQTLQATRDAWGRIIEVRRIAYAHGKITASHLLQRFEYDAALSVPTVVALPSIQPGKEHVFRYHYNTLGQLLDVTETGWDTQQFLTRTTRYRYIQRNGRSLLAEIDGPLKNGPHANPNDSDITRFEWDQKQWGGGNTLQGYTQPGGLTTIIERDDIGRPIRVTISDKARQWQTETEYSPQGQTTSIQQTAWLLDQQGHPQEASRLTRHTAFFYDARGALSRTIDPSGRTATFHFDTTGQLTSLTDMQGYESRLTLDGEGHALVAGLYEPNQHQPLRAWYHWFDQQGKQRQTFYPDGRLTTVTHDDEGRPTRTIDENNIQHLKVEHQGLQAFIEQAPDGDVRVKTQHSAELKDDFGRILQRQGLGHAFKKARYDEADRCIEREENGELIHFEYNTAGQLVRKWWLYSNDSKDSHPNKQSKKIVSTTLLYEGRFLVEMSDPVQTQRYERNAWGQPIRTHTLLIGLPAGQTFTTGTSFSEKGHPVRHLLADGRSLRIERDLQTLTATRLELSNRFWTRFIQWLPALPAAFESWLPSSTLLESLNIHPFNGWTSYRHGNGLKTSRNFDAAGRLTQLSLSGKALQENANYTYDIGPRIQQQNNTAYAYTGFGKLKSSVKTPLPNTLERDVWGRTISDGTFRYTYTLSNQVETVTHAKTQELVTRYAYNALHQRVSKTVYTNKANKTNKQPVVTYFLWQDNRLIAGIDATGHITDQYVYLTDSTSATPVAKLESHPGETERMLFIHTDQRGAPIKMTDAEQHVVWSAVLTPWGMAEHIEGSATLNIRLPGQYFDAETGLHDNVNRTYDPRPGSPNIGRYLTPDPIAGKDPYLYAGGDPINVSDPLGLYQIDVHYYMTYFLASMAGMNWYDAQKLALATQYVDDNPYTWPLDPQNMKDNPYNDTAINRLNLYHFTQDGFDRRQAFGESDEHYALNRIKNPSNP
ncbi:MAG: DUF6765 family protein [Pseudomonadota bacterium]